LIPSSIHVHLRSSEATIIGNQLCPTSWMVTEMRARASPGETLPSGRGRAPQKAIIGYSIPKTGPCTLTALGYGYSNDIRPYVFMVWA
jgi:hypothetical protein